MDTTTRQNIIDKIKVAISWDTKWHALRWAENAYWVNHIQFMDAIHEMWEGDTLDNQSDETLLVLNSFIQ